MTARELTTLTKYPQWHLEYQRMWISKTLICPPCPHHHFFFFSNLFLHLQLWKGIFERGKESVAVLGIKVRLPSCKSCALTTNVFLLRKANFVLACILDYCFFFFFLRIYRFWFGLHGVILYSRIMSQMNNLWILRDSILTFFSCLGFGVFWCGVFFFF